MNKKSRKCVQIYYLALFVVHVSHLSEMVAWKHCEHVLPTNKHTFKHSLFAVDGVERQLAPTV